MRVVAFDSKPFNRSRVPRAQGAAGAKEYTGYSTQLGMGVVVLDVEAFTAEFVSKFGTIKGEFGIDTSLPFMSTNGLLKHGRRKAIAFADKLVASVQDMIEEIHCCYVVLSPKKYETVKVGGVHGPAEDLQTRSFIDKLGTMFSYLAAQSYVYTAGKLPDDTEIRIDSFSSKQTTAWDILEKLKPKVYWKGDECDAAIACADLLAFLTDAKLYSGRHDLEHDAVRKVWEPYSFDVSVSAYGHNNVGICAWYSNEMIDLSPHLAKPTVFLSIDEIRDPALLPRCKEPCGPQKSRSGADIGPKPTTFRKAVRQLDVYDAAVRHAFGLSGSLKVFNFREDFQYVRDQDVFVYVGDNSKQLGYAFQSMMDVTVMSGADLRRLEADAKLTAKNGYPRQWRPACPKAR